MTAPVVRIEQTRPNLDPYPEYRDSGEGWLGEIPAQWEPKALKREFRVVNGSTPKTGEPENWDGGIAWVTPDDLGKGNQGERVIAEPTRYISERGYESCGTQMVGAGSLILSTRAPIGHLAIAGAPLCTNQGCRSLVPRRSNDETYFFFLLRAGRPVLKAAGRGSTFKELAKEALESIVLPIPPLDEQQAIAGFLDRETAKIDALVARKERLIALLQEKRTALITRAVTRGLDPKVPMKDSGVEWLGQLPAHWEVKRLGTTVTGCQNGVWGEEAGGLHDTICVRVADFDRTQFRVKLDTPTLRSINPRLFESHRLVQDDLLLEKSGGGDKQPVGAVVIYEHDRPAVCSNFVARMPVAHDHHPKYLTYLHAVLYALRINVRSIKQSTGIQNLDSASYLGETVGLPGLHEQRSIADYLDRDTAAIDALAAQVGQAIDLLHELRTALISAAVTGKIDVRETGSQ